MARLPVIVIGVLGLSVMPSAAGAATIVIFTDPMSMNRHTIVLDTPGPDRVLMCTPPPGTSCTEVPVRRARR